MEHTMKSVLSESIANSPGPPTSPIARVRLMAKKAAADPELKGTRRPGFSFPWRCEFNWYGAQQFPALV